MQPGTRIVNDKSYAPADEPTIYPVIKLEIEAILDLVPGAWAQPEDLMKWICSHSYVRSATLVTDLY